MRLRAFGLLGLLGLIAPPVSAAAAPPIIQSLEQLRRLPPEEAGQALPVRLTAVVTYYHHEWDMLFVQDAKSAAFVFVDHRTPPVAMAPGTLVEITGKTAAGDFEPSIASAQFRPVKAVGLPAPHGVELKEITTGSQDAAWIEVSGVVRSAAVIDDLLEIVLKMNGGKLKVRLKDWRDQPDFKWLVDSVVRVRGVCTTVTNEHRQFVGAEVWTCLLYTSDAADE